ncbi:hypothetical protein D2A34_09145 [Clostridium chromiireducens]|uniref:Uncharacterized protein n=1 Tax=Clostridium chromiireducens TaxID=225345 RepID=A0A399IS00_9CLOT|nr:hypothetical protein [Clostridium chromiireducens]RII35357.1 hypothetical protein D2A34_09145 [Clostridium chromiireducens]
MFIWNEKLKETNTIVYKKHKYKMTSIKMWGNYRIDIFEDDIAVVFENSANESFLKYVNKGDSIDKQIVDWASSKIQKCYGICDCCKDEKLIFELSNYDKERKEFKQLNRMCKKCRDNIYSQIFADIDNERAKEDRKFEECLRAKPPVIIGGFITRIEAYNYLRKLPEESIEIIDEEFIYAKAILKANDNTYYPVFCVIDKSSGGELWETEFVTENLDKYIPQQFIFPYINKDKVDIFPYTYETLAVIEEDFHQDSWFGEITRKKIKHHLSNLIRIKRSGNIQDAIDIEDNDNISVRTYFSIQHLISTALYRKEIRELENNLNKKYNEYEFLKHRSLCTSAIFSAVSFLEALINEFFSDSYDNPEGIVRDLPSEYIDSLGQMWELGIPRTASYNIVEKYQIALTLCKRDKINFGCSPGQDISVLIKLRNALIHFEPEWVVTRDIINNTKDRQKLEKLLMYKFQINKFTGDNNPFFPDKCLSYGCVDWALTNVIAFTDIFFISLGIVPPYEKIRFKIKNLFE